MVCKQHRRGTHRICAPEATLRRLRPELARFGITRIADITGLVGGLLMLAGAAVTGQPAPIVVAIERVSKQVKKVAASTPNKAA